MKFRSLYGKRLKFDSFVLFTFVKQKMAVVPYDSWDKFFKAFECANSTEFYSEEYPEYDDYINSNGTDAKIIAYLLAQGCSAQEGLDGLVKAVLGGSRYVCEMENDVISYVKTLLASGSKMCHAITDLLFARSYDNENCFEDEICNYNARALLIKAFDIDPSIYVPDWSTIKPVYWEYIQEDNGISYDTRRFMHLRFLLA